MPKIKILFLAANPKGTARVRADKEIRAINASWRRSQQRDRFEIVPVLAVTPADFRQALLDHRPQVVHFTGHGTADGLITLEGEDGQRTRITAEALAGLFLSFARTVECVVLNACHTERHAIAISYHVPHVIGMNGEIGDRSGTRFDAGFYDGLFAGESVGEAFNLGVNAVKTFNFAQHLIPVLKSNAPEARIGERMIAETDMKSEEERKPKAKSGSKRRRTRKTASSASQIFQAFQTGDGAIAQGPETIAGGKNSSIIKGNVKGGMIITGND